MNHLEEITEGLMETFRALRAGDMPAKDAQELNNTAGKVIAGYKTRIAYYALRAMNPATPMMQGLESSEDSTESTIEAAVKPKIAA